MNATERAKLHRQFFERFTKAQRLIGTWLYLGDLGVADVLCQQSFDFLIIDMEHSPVEFDTVRQILAITEGSCPTLVRIRANTRANVQCALDLGAAGVIVPMIQTPEDVVNLVQYGKYQPLGLRGVGPMRVSGYGSRMQAHLESANVEQLLIPQLESPQVLEHLDEILDIPGFDALFIGPADLAHGMGFLGKPSHERVQAVMRDAVCRVRERNIAVGAAFGLPGEVQSWMNNGVSFATVGCDFRFLSNAAQDVLRTTRDSVLIHDGHAAPPIPNLMPKPAHTRNEKRAELLS